MKVQLPVRWLEKKEMDDELRNLKKLIEGEEIEGEAEFTYGRLVLDTKDIKSFNELDEDNVIVRTYTPESYCIAIPFEDFARLYSELTCEMITKVERKEKKVRAPKKKDNPKPPSPDDEDFLK